MTKAAVRRAYPTPRPPRRRTYSQLLLFCALMLLLPLTARAATIMGTGITLSCGSWVELRKTPNKGGAEEWALGYLSGAAMWSPMSPLDGLDIGAVLVWMDNFCAQHPLVPFRGAIDEFIRQRAAIQAAQQQQQQQQRQAPPPQPAQQPQQPPAIRR